MKNLKVVARNEYLETLSGFAIGSAFFPKEIVLEKLDNALILRGDYKVWFGTGTYEDGFLFESPAPDSPQIIAKREMFLQILSLKDGKEESIWPSDPKKKLRNFLRDYKFYCSSCDYEFLPDLAKDESGHRIRMEEHTYFPPKGTVGREWQPIQGSSRIVAECPLCGKETNSLK